MIRRAMQADRMAGALHGLLASSRSFDSISTGCDVPPRSAAVCGLLKSLERNSKFVLADAVASVAPYEKLSSVAIEVLLTSTAIAMWLRGPDERISLATARFCKANNLDTLSGMAAVFTGQWLRRLYSRADAVEAWSDAMKSMPTIASFLRADPEAWTMTQAALSSDVTSIMHPVSRTLRLAREATGRASFCDMHRFLMDRSADSATLSTAATIGGMIHGYDDVVAVWPNHDLSPIEHNCIAEIRRRAQTLYRLERWPPETSETHPLPIASIPIKTGTRLGVSPGPGRNGNGSPPFQMRRTLSRDVETIVTWGARHVVGIVASDTLIDADMANVGPEIADKGIAFWHLPPRVSPSDLTFDRDREKLVAAMICAIERGESVLVHGLDFDDRAIDFAARLLFGMGEAESIRDATQTVSIAVELAKIGFSRHDQDE